MEGVEAIIGVILGFSVAGIIMYGQTKDFKKLEKKYEHLLKFAFEKIKKKKAPIFSMPGDDLEEFEDEVSEWDEWHK